MMAQLICRSLVPGYDGRRLLPPLDLEVEAGDYLCILGENGSGKSTLMKTILGLCPPVSGEVETGDGLSRREIGYLPQQTEVQRDFPASVGEVVLSGCLNRCGARPFYRRAEKERARENMERLGLVPLARRCYRELSGGQQQRVLLARALCATEKMLLLDEPVSGLDPQTAGELYALLREINRRGITVLMISHDVPAALRDARRVLHIGKSVFCGSREEYLRSGLAAGAVGGGEA